jgi:hypothetical protein
MQTITIFEILEELNLETEFENHNSSDDENNNTSSPAARNVTKGDTYNINNDKRPRTRSGKQIIPPSQLNLHQEHLVTHIYEKKEYTKVSQCMIAKIVHQLYHLFRQQMNQCAFMEALGLNNGLKHFGEKGFDAAVEEVKQLHDR